jgi:nucleoside-diphosphate-sugar epimerase
MNSLIIGHRGFVGSNLSRHIPDATGVGRTEIGSLTGSTFRNIFCAAPQAKKWWANQNPDQDRQEVENLLHACQRIGCTDNFILFSTVDVYDPPTVKTELDIPSLDTHPYGLNRIYLEQRILEHFGSKVRILRLPALVGRGLKKNIVYDLLNHNNIEQINANSSFQWFNLDFLGNVMKIVDQIDFPHILNVVSEPLPTADLVRTWFPEYIDSLNWNLASVGYDLRTIHGDFEYPYLFSKEEVLERHLKPFIEAQRAQ